MLYVDYDFTSKLGIYCESTQEPAFIHFNYKGMNKKRELPITLESDHVPNNARETLADSEGQFKITSNASNNNYQIHCDYAKLQLTK